MWFSQCSATGLLGRVSGNAAKPANTVKVDLATLGDGNLSAVPPSLPRSVHLSDDAFNAREAEEPPRPETTMLEQMTEAARGWLSHLTDISLEYDYDDLATATQGFSKDRRLGAGAAGAVYRGTLRGGTNVAVKVLASTETGFEEEVRALSQFRHPHVVTLFGFGQKGQERYLVYEFLPGGDVQHKLKKSVECPAAFPWQRRLHVAYDTACGLSHMMNSQPKAFHRDIKTANILIENNDSFTAKIADFGLAGIVQTEGKADLVVDKISGTPGYACPTYMQTGRVTEQSEVYSFGVVLLELLVNQPPALQGPQGDLIYPLLQTVQPAASGAHGRLLANLDRHAGWPRTELVDDLADLALSCVDMASERRPLFEQIVRTLHRLCQAVDQQGQRSSNQSSEGHRGRPAGDR